MDGNSLPVGVLIVLLLAAAVVVSIVALSVRRERHRRRWRGEALHQSHWARAVGDAMPTGAATWKSSLSNSASFGGRGGPFGGAGEGRDR